MEVGNSNAVETPIFVIGNPRSGTTMLRLMLTCHPNITVPPEGGFLVQLHEKYGGFSGDLEEIESFVRDVQALPKMEEWNLPSVALSKYLIEKRPGTYSELAAGVYEYYGQTRQAEGPRWGDKNNFFLNHIDLIASLFPAAKFVHIVRDGRDIACSYREMATVKGKYAPSLPGSVLASARQWRENLSKIERSFEAIGRNRVCQIRYENLVEDPEDTLAAVCSFVGESYSEQMVAFGERNREERLEPEVYDSWKGLTREELSSSRSGRWRTSMFAEDVALFEVEAGSTLKRYGYPRAFPSRNRKFRLFGAAYRAGYGLPREFLQAVRDTRRKLGRLRRTLRNRNPV